METQLAFEEFKLAKIQVPLSKPKSTKGFPFEFKLERRMIQEMGSFVEGSKDPTTQTSTPKSMVEVDVEVMKIDKAVELFQTMAIVNLNMGNLALS